MAGGKNHSLQQMLSTLPVARKDAILLVTAGVLMTVLVFVTDSKTIALTIALIAIVRGIYKWVTAPTVKTQVQVPLFK